MLTYFEGLKDKYFEHAETVRNPRHGRSQTIAPHLRFMNFPGGSFSAVIDTNRSHDLQSPDGHAIKVYIGGRDDAFFNDLPGFFRSINYAPQFYHVPHTMPDPRELKIPKTFLELEGNDLFNYDPNQPEWGRGVKRELPSGPLTWTGNKFKKDENGNYRFVYSGKDAQSRAELQCDYSRNSARLSHRHAAEHRIVNTWGESWVLKAATRSRRSRTIRSGSNIRMLCSTRLGSTTS